MYERDMTNNNDGLGPIQLCILISNTRDFAP